MNREAAQNLAIDTLQHLAGNPEELSRFLALTGIDVADLRAQASSPTFFASLLEFYLNHEPSLLAMTSSLGIEPTEISRAYSLLSETNYSTEHSEF